MKKIFTFVIVFALIGLIAGYFIYSKPFGEYINPVKIFLPNENAFERVKDTVTGIGKIRQNILISGGIGALLGLIVSVYKK